MSDYEIQLRAITGYGEAWATKDAQKRREILAAVFATEGVFEDPVASIRGRDAFDAHIAHFQQEFPDATFEITSAIDVHHRRHRFTWRMTARGGQVRLDATNVGRCDADGRLIEMVDFFHSA